MLALAEGTPSLLRRVRVGQDERVACTEASFPEGVSALEERRKFPVSCVGNTLLSPRYSI